MANTLTAAERAEAEALLTECQEAQTKFWELIGRLEGMLGCDIDSTSDLEGSDIDALMSADEDDE